MYSKLFSIVSLVLILCACKKEKKKEPEARFPGEFFISFKMDNTDHLYKTGPDYTYLRGTTMSWSPGGYGFHAGTYINALPLDMNVYPVGFVFPYIPACNNCDPDMTEYGNRIFVAGEKKICSTGVSMKITPWDMGCFGDNNGVTVFLTVNGKLLNSAAAAQPTGNYFVIDSVRNVHFDSPTYNLYSFDKIIAGRFRIRIFDPENKATFKDLTEGTFSMPVWRNDFK